jgi:hypothetical protein
MLRRTAMMSAALLVLVFILLGFLSECRLCKRGIAITPGFPGMGRLAFMSPLFLERWLLIEPRRGFASRFIRRFAERFAVMLWPALGARLVGVARPVVGASLVMLAGSALVPFALVTLAYGFSGMLFGERISLRAVRQRLNTDVVFLVGTPDLSGEQVRRLR